MTLMPSTIRSELLALLRTVRILSLTSIGFADESFAVPAAATPAAGSAEALLLSGLQSLLYARCYSHPLSSPPPTADAVPDSELPARLALANCGRERWDQGWQIYELGANGQISVLKGDRQRSALPGEYIADAVTGLAPSVGSMVSLHIPRESHVMQPGFYYMFSEVPTDIWDENFLIRFYFSCTAQGAPDLIRHITTDLNRFQVPYRMKVLTNSTGFTRTDPMVLYCARRYFPVVARITHSLPAAVLQQLKSAVPLFTKALRAGVAVADDPGNGQSFGMHRCAIVAEGMIQAWQQGQTQPETQLEAVAARFAQYGLTLDRPYLSPGATDVFDLAEPGARAA